MVQDTGFKLSLKDKRILYELDSDCRQSCSKIAKKVGLSTEVVNYRIKRLEEKNIITQYQFIANLSKLGILQFKICLSLQHMNSTKLNEIIGLLKLRKEVKWIVSCKGSWDIIISLETDTLNSIDLLKDEILSLFQGYINQKSISILVEASTYNRDYLIDDKSFRNKSRAIMEKDSVAKLDNLDLKILKKLSKNARMQIVDLAQNLKKSVRVVNYRLKRLLKLKVILGFKIALNYERLGINFYKLFLYLDNPKKERVKSLIRYCEQHPNIIHHVKVLGNWDLEPEFEVYSEKEFDKILKDIKDKYADIIKTVDIITISKEHKFVYF